ncbi:hypothetical protein BZA70DRAFT_77207 [Myxozyma melibiosi]|uniref:SUZ domain-containing protein n=1 Tax=Myxozyma melibiosi TaxID=54550 RepID=A0ABR1F0J5_9ASCO
MLDPEHSSTSSGQAAAAQPPPSGIRIMRRETPNPNDVSSEASSASGTNDSQAAQDSSTATSVAGGPGSSSSTPSASGSSATTGPGRLATTLEERAAAYEEARRRIFKDFEESEGDNEDGEINKSKLSETDSGNLSVGSGPEPGRRANEEKDDDDDPDFYRRSMFVPVGTTNYYQYYDKNGPYSAPPHQPGPHPGYNTLPTGYMPYQQRGFTPDHQAMHGPEHYMRNDQSRAGMNEYGMPLQPNRPQPQMPPPQFANYKQPPQMQMPYPQYPMGTGYGDEYSRRNYAHQHYAKTPAVMPTPMPQGQSYQRGMYSSLPVSPTTMGAPYMAPMPQYPPGYYMSPASRMPVQQPMSPEMQMQMQMQMQTQMQMQQVQQMKAAQMQRPGAHFQQHQMMNADYNNGARYGVGMPQQPMPRPMPLGKQQPAVYQQHKQHPQHQQQHQHQQQQQQQMLQQMQQLNLRPGPMPQHNLRPQFPAYNKQAPSRSPSQQSSPVSTEMRKAPEPKQEEPAAPESRTSETAAEQRLQED